MTIRVIGIASTFLLATALATVGCGEAERLYDCARICDGYADCVDDSVDRADCTERCEDQGEADPDFAEQANECEQCIDDESCADAAVQCTTTCAFVVAEST